MLPAELVPATCRVCRLGRTAADHKAIDNRLLADGMVKELVCRVCNGRETAWLGDLGATTFQALWHGPPLSALQRAAISSFVARGHAVDLYAYEELDVPAGVRLCAANDVLAREEMFFFRNPQTNVPDLGPFSDLFRFKLLKQRGGWYVDVDTFCLSDNIPPYLQAWARQDSKANPTAVGTGQIAFPAGGALVTALFEACESAARGFTSREALGPHLISRLLNEARLPLDMNGSNESFYPVGWIESFKLWLPEFAGEIAERTQASIFLPYYQSLPRYMGFLDLGLPPEGSFLSDQMTSAGGWDPDARRIEPQDIRQRVAAWFEKNSDFAPAEFRTMTGQTIADALECRRRPVGGSLPPAYNRDDNSGKEWTMSEGLEAIIAKLDESIVAMFRERERLISTLGEVAARKSSLAPFVVPFALGAKRQLEAFEELAPGFWFGYPSDATAKVLVEQAAPGDFMLAPPDHHFTVSFEVEDAGGAAWMTLEKGIEPLQADKTYRVTIALKAKAPAPLVVRFELSVPCEGGEDQRFLIGTATLSRSYEAMFLSQVVELGSGVDPTQPARLIAFLPPEDGIAFSLAYYNTLITPRQP